jgi:uncharacterized protein YggL (DUF469 family)
MLTQPLRINPEQHPGQPQEFGFELRYTLHDGSEEIQLLARFFELLEARDMAFSFEQSGQLFLCRADGGSLGELDRRAVRHWLDARSEVAGYELGELIDARTPPRGVHNLANARGRRKQKVQLLIAPGR